MMPRKGQVTVIFPRTKRFHRDGFQEPLYEINLRLICFIISSSLTINMCVNLLLRFLLVFSFYYFLVVETKPTGKECQIPSKQLPSTSNITNSAKKEQNPILSDCTPEGDEKDDTTSSVLPDIPIMIGITAGIIIILKLRSSISYYCSSLKKTIVECLDRGELTEGSKVNSNQHDNEGQENSAYYEPEKTKS